MYFLALFRCLYVCVFINTVSVWAHISTNETFDWMSSNDKFKNTSFSKWTSSKDASKAKFVTKSFFSRNLQDANTKIKSPVFSNYFTLDESNKRNDYKKIPLEIERAQSFGVNEHPVHRSTVFSSSSQNINKQPLFPNNVQASVFSRSQETYNLPLSSSSYKAAATDFHTVENFNYLHSQTKPMLYVNNSINAAQVNTRHILYLQHGKCSNSVEISRIRDIQIKSTLKHGLRNEEAVCVLMLYTTSENNKLAVSLQPIGESISSNITNTVNWLEESVKVFPLYEGKITQLYTKSNFGPNSPALILTKSNIVLISITSNRSFDFQMDISTYQSSSC